MLDLLVCPTLELSAPIRSRKAYSAETRFSTRRSTGAVQVVRGRDQGLFQECLLNRWEGPTGLQVVDVLDSVVTSSTHANDQVELISSLKLW